MRSWFDEVPAYRLAVLRTCLALTTLLFALPMDDARIRSVSVSVFHFPEFAWVPAPSWSQGSLLIFAGHLAAWLLLFGVWTRVAAAFLALRGLYVMWLDPEYFSHNGQLHLLLVAIFAFARDGVSLPRLLGLVGSDDDRAWAPAWPEWLVRAQLVLMFAFTAVDKVLSPDWGGAGARLAALEWKSRSAPLDAVQTALGWPLSVAPGASSVATIALELAIPLLLALPATRRLGAVVTAGFLLTLELFLAPNLFPWDVIAALVVFVDAGDRSHGVLYTPDCAVCRRQKRLVTALDWLRRLRWEADTGAPAQLVVILPTGERSVGYDGFRRIVRLLAPGSIWAFLIALRFGAFGENLLGVLRDRDAALLAVLALGALYSPGVARWIGAPVYRRAIALLRRLTAPLSPAGTCARHS